MRSVEVARQPQFLSRLELAPRSLRTPERRQRRQGDGKATDIARYGLQQIGIIQSNSGHSLVVTYTVQRLEHTVSAKRTNLSKAYRCIA
jgi:hypothetical protein